MPILLLSPILVRDSVRLRFIRSVVNWTPAGRLLSTFARTKYRQLLDNDDYVLKQLSLFIGKKSLNESLIGQAKMRIRDPRVAQSIEHTARFLRYATKPVSAQADVLVKNRRVLVGVGVMDRRIAKRMTATVLHGVTGAAMIEEPNVVAEAMRELFRSSLRDQLPRKSVGSPVAEDANESGDDDDE